MWFKLTVTAIFLNIQNDVFLPQMLCCPV